MLSGFELYPRWVPLLFNQVCYVHGIVNDKVKFFLFFVTKSSLTIPKPERIIINLTFLVTDQTIGNFRHLGTRGNL